MCGRGGGDPSREKSSVSRYVTSNGETIQDSASAPMQQEDQYWTNTSLVVRPRSWHSRWIPTAGTPFDPAPWVLEAMTGWTAQDTEMG